MTSNFLQGRFEILSLSGSFTVNDTGGVRSRTGGLSVSLAGPDGRVVGGGIAGLLTAASPIQVSTLLNPFGFLIKENQLVLYVLFMVIEVMFHNIEVVS